MKQGLTELVFVLDRSGSMSGLEDDTIGGFNSMIEKQKHQEGEAVVSVVLFNDTAKVIYDREDIREIPKMTKEQYYVRGCTALLDALGGSIHYIKTIRKGMRQEDQPEKTIFIITTDGMENSSKHYTYEKVRRMIEKYQERNWEFIFLGANIDAGAEAKRMGIKESRAVNYNCDSQGTQLNYEVLSQTVSRMRESKSAAAMTTLMDEEDCFDAIRMDYANRRLE